MSADQGPLEQSSAKQTKHKERANRRTAVGAGLGIGLAFGVVFGLLLNSLAVGAGVGLAIGLAAGLALEAIRKDSRKIIDDDPEAEL